MRSSTHNFRQSFAGHRQEPRAFVTDDDQGLLICTWPRGGRPAVPTQYSDEVWTGMEYEVAALLLQEGEPERALQIVDAVRARYDGRKQNPWNDIECGDHYVRAMASWSLLEAASGYAYDAAKRMIGFAPVIRPETFRAPFVGQRGLGHGRADRGRRPSNAHAETRLRHTDAFDAQASSDRRWTAMPGQSRCDAARIPNHRQMAAICPSSSPNR